MAFDPSHLDTSAGALIRSGAALLGIVLGGFVLAAKPRGRFARLFGLVLVLDGVGYSVFTLAGGYAEFPHKELVVPSHLVFAPIAYVAAGLLLAAFWSEVRQLPSQRVRFTSGLVAAAPPVLLAPIGFVLDGLPPVEDYGSGLGAVLGMVDSIGYSVYLAVLAVVGAALLARVRRDPADPRARALLLVGVYAVANAVIQAGNYLADAPGYPPAVIVLLLLAVAATVQLPFAFLGLQSVGGWSRWVPIVLLLACLATAPIEALAETYADEDVGFGGIVSLAALLCIGYAIFRLDLLGVRVPRPGFGFVAALALAALFITAQFVQNFASSNFSLKTGAVVAGLAVLLANPLQKRIEGFGQRRSGVDAPATKYRRLVETAWTDGTLGANERLLLAEARRQLGVGAEAAAAIDEAVAAGHARRVGRPASGGPGRRRPGP